MPHQFTEYPPEPEPQPASSRGTRPPRKRIGVALLDRPEPLPAPAHPTERPFRIRIPLWFGALLMAGAVIILLLLSGRL